MKNTLSLFIVLLVSTATFAQAPAIQWQKSIGGSKSEAANSIIQTSDGGYIVAGYSFSNDADVSGHHGDSTTSDCWIVKLNSVGTIQWEQSYGGAGNETATSIIQTSDGGYIFTGISDSTSDEVTGNHGGYDIWVVKIDTAGNLQWEQSYGGSGDDEASSIIQTSDGGYLLGGNTTSTNGTVTSNHGDADFWAVKLSSTGAIQWQNTYGGSYNDWGYYAIQTSDGGYLLGGISESIDGQVTGNHGSIDFWLVKTDTAGNLQWEQSYGGTNYDAARSSVQTSDGGYIVAGISSSINCEVSDHHGNISTTDYWVVKIDTAGNLQWEQSYGGSSSENVYSIIQTSDGGYTMAGASLSNDDDVSGHHGDSTTSDCWIVKINEYPTGINTPIGQANARIYPNPASNNLVLEVSSSFIGGQYKLTDISGRQILTGNIENEISEYTLVDLTAGLYVLEISNNDRKVFKIVKQ